MDTIDGVLSPTTRFRARGAQRKEEGGGQVPEGMGRKVGEQTDWNQARGMFHSDGRWRDRAGPGGERCGCFGDDVSSIL